MKLLNSSKFGHPKKNRLLKRIEFKRLFHSRTKFHGRFFSVEYTLRKDLSHPRLGITITRQYGKAHLRNQFKRRLKEIFRNYFKEIGYGIDMNVRAKPKQASSYIDLLEEFQKFVVTLKSRD